MTGSRGQVTRFRFAAMIEPNFKNQRRTVSYDTSSPRSANISSTSRRLNVNRAYNQIELVITSAGKR